MNRTATDVLILLTLSVAYFCPALVRADEQIYTAGYVRANYYKSVDNRKMQVVETSAPINEGDSGGPILNADGQLVGITQSYRREGRLVSNGVDISEVRWFVEKVRDQMAAAAAGQGDSNPNQPRAETTPETAGRSLLGRLASNTPLNP